MPKKANSFEDKLQALESIVEKMEAGDLKLEDALKHFEEGVGLARQCQESLKAAEQKVDKLLANTVDSDTAIFETEENNH